MSEEHITEKFKEAYNRWRIASGMCSVFHHAMQQDGYKELEEMGKDIVAYLIQELENGNGGIHTCFLLSRILGGFDPSNLERGKVISINVKEVVQSWINWWNKSL